MRRSIVLILFACFLSIPVLGKTASAAEDASSPDELTVSLNMPDVPIVDALRMLAKLGGVNLIVDSKASGTVNLFFQDVPFEEAWNALLESASLQYERKGGLIRVFPKQSDAQSSSASVTQVYRLKHVSLGKTELTGGFGESGQNTFSSNNSSSSSSSSSRSGSTGSSGQLQGTEETSLDEILIESFTDRGLKVSKDERTNHIVLTGPPSVVKEAADLLEQLDRPVEQILIEAKVLQARLTALDDLGIHWGGVYTIKNSGGVSLSSDRISNNPGNLVTESGDESGTFSSTLNDFNVTVSALLENGDARVLSSPRVVTQNNREAFISSGQEIQVPSGLDINGNATYRERQVTLELGVTPRVLGGSQINLTIRLRNDSINYSQQQISGVPPLDVNTVESIVSLSNRDTVAIGGIITETDSYNTFRVPILSDIPLLGSAFRHRSKTKENSELIILITPVIITNEDGIVVEGNGYEDRTFWNQANVGDNKIPARGDSSKSSNETERRRPDGVRLGAKNFHSR